MVVEDGNDSFEEYKRKLYALDELVCNNSRLYEEFIPQPSGLRAMAEFSGRSGPVTRFECGIDCDEVYPRIILGNAGTARHKAYLRAIGVTHVLNCAQGQRLNQVSTDECYYRDVGIHFMGLSLDDVWMEDISRYFEQSSRFMQSALEGSGKVLVHCWAGVSRSATIVVAFLMRQFGLSAEEAMREVVRNRRVLPNTGFLKQLVQYELLLNK